MLQQLYAALTTYEGMYVCYLIPIVYFLFIVLKSVLSRTRQQKSVGIREVAAVVAILLIAADFVNYLYLLFSGTGKLLPSTWLFAKYAVGCIFWLWVFWYSYEAYFSRRVAGKLFARRLTILVLLLVGTLVLGGIGMVMS